MGDRNLRLLISADSARAIRALDEIGIRAQVVGRKTEAAFGDRLEGAAGKSGGALSKLSSTLGSFGLPFTESLDKVGEKLAETETKGKRLGAALSEAGKVALLAGGAAAIAVGAEALKLGEGMQQTTAGIAASADIPIKAAQKIQSAFNGMSTGMKTTFSGQQLAAAYATVAGQLGSVEGHALGAAEATKVMSAAGDLAEASNSDLALTTQSLAKIMQAYGVDAAHAAEASDVVFSTSRATGQTIDLLTQTYTRLRSSLGALAPSLSDTSALIVDLTNHGETGRQAVSGVSSGLQFLLANIRPTQTAVKDLTARQDALAKAHLAVEGAQLRLTQAQEKNKLAPTQASAVAVTLATNALTAAQLSAKDAQDKLNAATATAPARLSAAQIEAKKLGLALYDNQGQFVGISSLIDQLQPKLAAMTQAQQMQALQALFGATASQKLLDVILAGPQVFDKASRAVTAHGAAHDAAEKQASTLKGSTEKLEHAADTLGGELGIWLIPKVTALAGATAKAVTWFEKHKAVAEALAGVVAGTLSLAIGAFTVNKIAGLVRGLGTAKDAVGNLISKVTGLGGGSGLAGEGEAAAGSLDGAATKLQLAADQITAAAEKLSGAGTAAGAELTSAAATAETDLAAGGAEAEASMAAGGATASAEEATGGSLAGAAMSAGIVLAVGAALEPLANKLPGANKVSPAAQGVENVTKHIPVVGPLGNDLGNSIVHGLGWGPQPELSPKQIAAYTVKGLNGVPLRDLAPAGTLKRRRAAGGPVSAGVPYLVGEEGPEPFVPDVPGRIVPHSKAKELLGVAAGHQTIYQIEQVVVVAQNPAEFEQKLQQRKRVGALAGGSARTHS